MLNWDASLGSAISGLVEPSLDTSTSSAPANRPVGVNLHPVPDANNKGVVNGSIGINQIAPLKYSWAREYFLTANKNHWTPLDINMTQDGHDYQHKLTPEEHHVFENVLSYLITTDILALRNMGLAVADKITSLELQMYQARQINEKAVHAWAYQHCIETIGLDLSDIYNRYRVVPEIHHKIKTGHQRLSPLMQPDIDLNKRDDLENFILAYTFLAGIFEGTWRCNCFNPIFALQRRGLMKGSAGQLQYIMRDGALHTSFGIKVCNQIIQEEKIKLDPKIIQLMWEEAEAVEFEYANFLLPKPILGYCVTDHMAQFRFIANRCANQLNHSTPFTGAESGLSWLDEQTDLKKEKNDFDTRVTEYQTGGALNWD